MKKVLTVGVFDYFHLGHLRLFKKAKEYGDYLIVAVQDENGIKKTKPNTKILYSVSERIEMIDALLVVDEVMIYQDVYELVKKISFDVLIVGEDQLHEGFVSAIDYCEKEGKCVIRLQRTEGISSTKIKNDVLQEIGK